MDGSSAQGQPAHGGGPTREAPAPSGASRKDMLHNASPHIVAVQTQLAAAREESQGIDRLASLSGGTLNPEYREHVGVFARSVGTDLTTARTHLEHLRTSADQLGIMNKVSGDFTSAEQALDQARRSVGQMEQASGDVNQLKNTNRDLGRQLQQAKDAVGRIEHAMK
jgi:septation ring formation regulator EzrA